VTDGVDVEGVQRENACMTIQEFTQQLVRDYMHSQWANYRREVGEFKAREELLGGALLYSYESGTTTPAVTFRDAERNTQNANPVAFYASGEMPPVFVPATGCDVRIASHAGETIARLSNATG
jgi:hypothetical protein